MAEPNQKPELERDISIHIFTASVAMLGVCLTVVGVLQVVSAIGKLQTVADDLLAIDSLLFAAASILAYWALRTRSSRRRPRVERVADVLFVTGLIIMSFVAMIITYAFSAGRS